MVVQTNRRGDRAQVLLNHEEGLVVAEILNPDDPPCRTVKFSPLWRHNHRDWKDAVARSANSVLDADRAAETTVMA